PTPRDVGGQRTAEQQADRATGTGQGTEDAEGLRALLGVGEGGGQQAQRGRGEQRREDTLAGAGRDQRREVRRGTAGGGGDREAGEADQEGVASTEQVTEAATDQQQRAEAQRVGRDDPLAVGV